MKRKICVPTGARSEYGLLKPLLEELKKDPAFKLQLVVTGMHLSKDFGLTYQEIEGDGFAIDEKVDIELSSDTTQGISHSLGLAIERLAQAYGRLKPDIVVILGDRFEIFSAAVAAHVSGIPIAHIHGGELTEGIMDEAFRHAITKMSYLHFTATEEYRRRVIQLGEAPERVFNVGALGLDNIRRDRLFSKGELERELNVRWGKRNLLVTFHPVTLQSDAGRRHFQIFLDALNELKDTLLIFTKANADLGGRTINQMIDDYVQKKSSQACAFVSMGQKKYLSTMRCVDAVVGNSSSGIIEAPSLKVGTINVGDRQQGRVLAKSVITCPPTIGGIRQAFDILYSKKFQDELKKTVNPYGDGRTAPRIKKILKNYKLTSIKKHFFYVNFRLPKDR